jgi:hypothetical protein
MRYRVCACVLIENAFPYPAPSYLPRRTMLGVLSSPLKRYVTQILQKYLGKYIKGIELEGWVSHDHRVIVACLATFDVRSPECIPIFFRCVVHALSCCFQDWGSWMMSF